MPHTVNDIQAKNLVSIDQIALDNASTEQSEIDFGRVEVSSSDVLLSNANIEDIDVINFGNEDFNVAPIENLEKIFFRIISGSIGEEGDGIREITVRESHEDGGENVVTVTLSNGEKTIFSIRNGHRGTQGDPGAPGEPGAPGKDADIEAANTAINLANDAAKKADIAANTATDAATAANNVDADLQEDILSVTNREGETKQVNVRGPKGDTTVTALNHYTLQQYLQLKEQNKLENIFYSIYNKDDVLIRVYLGATLVGKKAEDGERVTIGATFPLVFPIIFA